MYVQFSGHGDTADNPEEGEKEIETKGQYWVTGEAVVESDGDEVDQTEHCEHSAEHGIVDYRRRTVLRFANYVPGKRHDEQGPEKL